MLSALRHVFRALLRKPGHTLAALLTLTFGVGLNALLVGNFREAFAEGFTFREPHRVQPADALRSE